MPHSRQRSTEGQRHGDTRSGRRHGDTRRDSSTVATSDRPVTDQRPTNSGMCSPTPVFHGVPNSVRQANVPRSDNSVRQRTASFGQRVNSVRQRTASFGQRVPTVSGSVRRRSSKGYQQCTEWYGVGGPMSVGVVRCTVRVCSVSASGCAFG